jgi:hypothetical protein
MFPNQFIDPLESRHDMLQSAIASLPVGSAGMEARDRPGSAVGVIDDWNDNNPQRSLAIQKALQIGHNQLLDLFLRLGHPVHVGDRRADSS